MTDPRPSIEWTRVAVDAIHPNPQNPRVVRDAKFRDLVQSIRSFPQMLELRPIIVDADGMILGGNARYKAALEAGLEEIPVVYAHTLTEEQKREFVIRDNVAAGEWDFVKLLDAEAWGAEIVKEWGVDLPFQPNADPSFDGSDVDEEDVGEAEKGQRERFEGASTTLRDVTCPHCSKTFGIADD